VLKRIYCKIHQLLGCSCLGKILREDIEYELRKALIKRFNKYCRLDRVSIGSGISRISLEIRNRVRKSGNLVSEVDRWIYQLLSLYSEFSYWICSLRRSLNACKSIELIWLMGYSQCYIMCPEFFQVYKEFNNQYECSIREVSWNGFIVDENKRKYKRVFQNYRSPSFKGSVL